MAPELVLELQRLRGGGGGGGGGGGAARQPSHDERVDWWAAGCLVYELLSGRPPCFLHDPSPTPNPNPSSNPNPSPSPRPSAQPYPLRTPTPSRPPFFSTRDKILERKILNEPLAFPPAAFGNVSHEAQDLIGALLARNPADRLAGPALVRHPWVREP